MASNQQQGAGDAIMSAINEAPPVIRFYAGMTFGLSLASLALRIIDPYLLFYHWSFLSGKWPPQIWRVVTAFFLTRPKLAILFNSYYLYDYGRRLEKDKFRWSGEFIFYMGFTGMLTLIVDTVVLGGGGGYAENMCVIFLYTWAQQNRGQLVRFWFLTMKAQWYPYAYIVVATLMDGAGVGMSLCVSLAASHMYEFLTNIYPRYGGGRNFLETPRFLQFNFAGGPVSGSSNQRQQQRGGSAQSSQRVGQNFSGGGRTTSSSTSSGSASSFWRSRGQGQRLGGS